MRVRQPAESETAALARIWYDGWRHAHARIVPEALARQRTLESFQQRIDAGLAGILVVGQPGQPVGFCMVRQDELHQLYVTAAARGFGAAACLLAGAEARLESMGVQTMWLACAIGNERARKFYVKHGWHNAGIMTGKLEVPGGNFELDVWRYEKTIRAVAGWCSPKTRAYPA